MEDLMDEEDFCDDFQDDDSFGDIDLNYNDMDENPGDYDEDGERGYWADL